MNLKVDDMVIPISKSIGDDWEHSTVIQRMKRKGQNHLYVVDVRGGGDIICSDIKGGIYNGNYFHEQDLLPFYTTRKELNNHLLNGIIDIDTYQSLIKEVE